MLEAVEKKLGDDTEIAKDKKEGYVRLIRQMNYTIARTLPRWPQEVEKIVDNLRSILQEFENTLIAIGKGTSFFCGSSTNPKQLDNIFNRLVGYEHTFEVISPFQDQSIKNNILSQDK